MPTTRRGEVFLPITPTLHASTFLNKDDNWQGDMVSNHGSESLDFSKLFVISNAFQRGALHFWPVQKLPFRQELLRGEVLVEQPVEFRWESGRTPLDLLGTTYAALLIASERFVTVLEKEGFTGWTTYPVFLHQKNGQILPGYSGLSVTGRAGPIDPTRSRVEQLPPAVPGAEIVFAEVGMYFDPKTWDGSDFFIPQGTAAVCVTERVRAVLQKERLTNLHFDPLTQRQLRFVPPPADKA